MASNRHYQVLINILDQLRKEAPAEFTSYHPEDSDSEGLSAARSKAFIHLFLKVKFGLARFRDRHPWITDGTQDGGVDAYYLDLDRKKLTLLQSKFRHTEDGFRSRRITADDLVKMEIVRILRGEQTDSRGLDFNDKIRELQQKWRSVSDPASYTVTVVILGDLRNYSNDQVKRLLDDNSYEVFDHERTYMELVYPLCAGTLFDPDQIEITIKLQEDAASTLRRRIDTKYGSFQVRVLFVPASEIGRILSKYKNSILKFNPRSYLALSRNKVNQQIRAAASTSETNEFALFNNGITMVSRSCEISETTGDVERGQLILKNPQIINGGQTAYTLSKIFEEGGDAGSILKKKEVMLRVIVIGQEEINQTFIEDISAATNQQTRVEEADRRSNDPVQISIQENLFQQFGLFYERKRGEFYHGLDSRYISQDLIIDRYELLRAYMAFKGEPRWARQRGSEVLFRTDQFSRILDSTTQHRSMYFAYRLFRHLNGLSESDQWGMGLRYGKMAIIAAVKYAQGEPEYTEDNLEEKVSSAVTQVHSRWKEFERWASSQPANKNLYGTDSFDFDNYYKGKTVDQDVKGFFSPAIVQE